MFLSPCRVFVTTTDICMKMESMFIEAQGLRPPAEEALGGNLPSPTPTHAAPMAPHVRLLWPLRERDAIQPDLWPEWASLGHGSICFSPETTSLHLQAYIQTWPWPLGLQAVCGVLSWRMGQPAGLGWASGESWGQMTVNRPTGLKSITREVSGPG